MVLKGKTIAFIGDSITANCAVVDPCVNFVHLVEKEGEFKKAHNCGLSGSRIAFQEKLYPEEKADSNFIVRADAIPLDSDIVCVFGGTNDFGHGDAPMGNFKSDSPYTFYGALHIFYKKLIERFLGKEIVIITPLHRWNEECLSGDVKEKDVATLKDYVKAIREVAEFYSLPILDLFANSGLQPSIPIIKQTFIPDGLHPNAAGHRVIANKILNFLKML